MYRHLLDDTTEVIPNLKLDVSKNQIYQNRVIRMRSYFNNFLEKPSNQSQINQSETVKKEKYVNAFIIYYTITIKNIYNNRMVLKVKCIYEDNDYSIDLEKHSFNYIWYFGNNTYQINNINSQNCEMIIPNLDYLHIYIKIINDYLFKNPPISID